MSGIFRKDATTSDSDAFLQFIAGSQTTILSDSSNHALVLKIAWKGEIEDHIPVNSSSSSASYSASSTAAVSSSSGGSGFITGLKRERQGTTLVGSPYARIWYNDNEDSSKAGNIVIEDAIELVLKLVPINIADVRKNRVGSHPENSIRFSEESEISTKYISSPAVWWNEVIIQRLAFHSTFMIDFQMQAVTPNILIAFFVGPTYFEHFSGKFHMDKLCKTKFDAFMAVMNENSLRIGCTLMEYMSNAIDFKDYGTAASWDDVGIITTGVKPKNYDSYMEAKAFLDVQVDKLHFVGIYHKDLHDRNAASYTNPRGKLCATILDFGKATIVTDKTLCETLRGRLFNSLPTNILRLRNAYIKYMRNDPSTYYMKDCIILPESNPHIVLGEPRNYFLAWHKLGKYIIHEDDQDRFFKVYNKTIEGDYDTTPVGMNHDRMNAVDRYMVERGMLIETLLVTSLNASKPADYQSYINADTKFIGRYTRNIKNGGNSMLLKYIHYLKLSENCNSMLKTNDPFCIADFDSDNDIAVCNSSASSSSGNQCVRDIASVTELGKVLESIKMSAAGAGSFSTTLASSSGAGGGGLGTASAATSSSSAAGGFAAEGKTNSRKNRSRKSKTRRTTVRKTRRNNRSRF